MGDGSGPREGIHGLGAPAHDAMDNVAPASTLAAQLVENLSTSTRLSRNEENKELDGFLATIQRVADHPELLKSTSDRIEHNHMISYVYTRAALDGIKLEDPVLDPKRLRNDALKAINFLRFSIKETPTLLTYRSDGGFLFRGQEPLWVWLVPRLLRLLGHENCLDLQGSIEGFLQFLQLTAARHGNLWEFAAALAQYLRSILNGTAFGQSLESLD
jgi:serine/threonine-protein kinase ATR